MTAAERSGSSVASVGDLLRHAKNRLAGLVASADVEAEIILMHCLGRTRAELYKDLDISISDDAWTVVEGVIERRLANEPLQYLTGVQQFRSLVLEVGPGVLVPRPETEVVAGIAIEKISRLQAPRAIDIGTGSGAIALSLATEAPACTVFATDISPEALQWARKNIERIGVRNVTIFEGDLFEPLDPALRGAIDLIVCNPPYLAEAQILEAPRDVRDHEPRIATVAGKTGLEIAARVVEAAPAWLRSGGWLVLETWPGQWPELQKLLSKEFVELQCSRDFAGMLRVAEAKRR